MDRKSVRKGKGKGKDGEGSVRENPKAVLDAVVRKRGLTIAQLAILERLDSPLFVGDVSNLTRTLVSVWAVSEPVDVVIDRLAEAEDYAVKWAHEMGVTEYQERLCEVLEGIREFWEMLPRPEKKKGRGSVTDGSPS